MFIKKITILLLLGLSSLYAKNDLMIGLVDIVNEAEEKKSEDKKVLNYLFKQRMRTQWIARDALLITMDFNSSFYQKEMLQKADAFNKNLNSLLDSKKDIEKAEKKDSNFTETIKDLNATWRFFYESVKKISKNSKDKEALKFIEENNIKLLNDIAYIVTSFMKSYHSTNKLEASMEHIKSMLYTKVGKPRVYINKLIKERFLVNQNMKKESNQKKLEQSIKDMDSLIKALKDGDKILELHGTEDRQILEKMDIGQKIWEEIKNFVQKKKLTEKDIIALVKKNDDFIKAQTEVVKLIRASNDN